MKITKGIISRDEAVKLAPDYVAFCEGGDWGKFDVVDAACQNIKRGRKVVTCVEGVYVEAKVTSVKHDDFRAVDGPVIRVGNSEFTWRVDGDKWCYPV